MAKLTTAEKKQLCLKLINQGKNNTEIEIETGMSIHTVIKYRRTIAQGGISELLMDKRKGQNLGLPTINQEILALAISMRQNENSGGAMLAAKLRRLAMQGKTHFKPSEVPSDATIERELQRLSLSKRPVGPKDKRGYPSDYTAEPGHLTIDGWGPYHGAATTIFAVTVHDRPTRLTYQLPGNSTMSAHHYIHAIKTSIGNLLGGVMPLSITTDNGVGAKVANGHTAQAIRYAMMYAKRVIFIPPGQPWRNGRLENTHWRMEKEFWRRPEMMRETSAATAIAKFGTWTNFYNTVRPQTQDKDRRPPAKIANGFMPVTGEHIQSQPQAKLEPQAGIMDVIRLVESRGHVDLWAGDNTRLQEVFMGQYVRLRFYVEPQAEQQYGEVIWRSNHENEPIVVATFNHKVERNRKRAQQVITDIRYHDFDVDDVGSHSVRIDQMQHDNQVARITKRPHRTGGDFDYTGQEPTRPESDD